MGFSFKIRHKIFLLAIFVSLGAIAISSYTYYNNIKQLAKDYAYKDLSHDIGILTTHINTIESEVDNLISIASNNENIVMSLNLISNYQDKNDYDRLVFNIEKKKILTNLENLLGQESSWSMAIFDKDGDTVAFKRKSNNKIVFGYSDFEMGEISIYNKNDILMKSFKPKRLDVSILNRHDIFSRKKEFVFKKAVPIKHNNEVIGYIRVGFVINEENYYKIASAIQNDSKVLTKKLEIGSKDLNIKLNEILKYPPNTLLQKDGKFITYTILKSIEDVVIISFSDTEKLDKTLLKTLEDLTFISFIIMALLLIVTILFSNYFINAPLDRLLDGIKALKNKNGKKIEINSSDEISELAKEFNEISYALSRSFKTLETTNLFLENILNTVHISIFIKDTEGHYIKANKSFLDNCGIMTEIELVGRRDIDIYKKEDALLFRQKDKEVIESLKPILNFEGFLTKHDGTVINILTSKMPLIDKDGTILGVLGIYEDITEQKKIEKKLKDKETYLLQQSRLAQMGEMISMIAHQWRQPLSAISSTTNALMLKNMMNKYEKEFFGERLKNISDYSQHLSSTIDDFRNFFKKTKDKKEISLENIVDDSLKITQVAMENKNISILKEFNCNETLLTFPNELRQVVLNLLKNAEDILVELEKDEKWIKIKTYKMGERFVLEVSDNAGGVPEELIDKIFEPYFSTKQNKDGTGLGLYMSKSIIEDHCNGKLSVTNNKDGAIFKVEL